MLSPTVKLACWQITICSLMDLWGDWWMIIVSWNFSNHTTYLFNEPWNCSNHALVIVLTKYFLQCTVMLPHLFQRVWHVRLGKKKRLVSEDASCWSLDSPLAELELMWSSPSQQLMTNNFARTHVAKLFITSFYHALGFCIICSGLPIIMAA